MTLILHFLLDLKQLKRIFDRLLNHSVRHESVVKRELFIIIKSRVNGLTWQMIRMFVDADGIVLWIVKRQYLVFGFLHKYV